MMKKELGPMAMHHNGPDNKATGNGKNSISSENVGKIAQSSDTIKVSSKYKPGDYVEEYELEKRIKKQTEDFPQLSVQDYSEVRKNKQGKNVVVKLND